MSCCRVDELVYTRQGEAVFGEYLVRICEIYARPPLPVWFNNQYQIG